ncbi:unnamed protein product [Cyprideis torosa]|uniref:Uncharacterized protein n=1 Tax=Cyprideis torosa TaxID=163714 RepID=A0A7R8WIA7_9CRUS|nr:unnamed protein product [Cyprideis torosa]CAG0900508.1 unnamed protein product [Cyprideis torosa]
MGSDTLVLRDLKKLCQLSKTSDFVYPNGRDLVLLAFNQPKPLFPSPEDKAAARPLVQQSLPLLEKAFKELHGSLNIDLRQVAQKCRSGLQFLVDEFHGEQIYKMMAPVLESSPVKCVEEFIKNTEGMEPEFSKTIPQDMTKIPDSHYWWFEQGDESDDE